MVRGEGKEADDEAAGRSGVRKATWGQGPNPPPLGRSRSRVVASTGDRARRRGLPGAPRSAPPRSSASGRLPPGVQGWTRGRRPLPASARRGCSPEARGARGAGGRTRRRGGAGAGAAGRGRRGLAARPRVTGPL